WTMVENNTDSSMSSLSNEHQCSVPSLGISIPFQATLFISYSSVGICSFIGNLLVLVVVLAKKELRTVTNLFISSVSAADLLITAFSLWATPLAYFQQVWKFGQFMCYGVSAIQGASLIWSPLTLAAIAVDRYKLVSSPFNPQINTRTCLAIIMAIWAGALLMLMPMLAHVHYFKVGKCYQYCVEIWPEERYFRLLYGLFILLIRSVVPLIIISFCHYRIACVLNEQTTRLQNYRSTTSIRHAMDINRKQRLQTLLLIMVIIFAVTSIPLDIFNVLQDVETVFRIHVANQSIKAYMFLFTHWVAMAGTLLNPLVYAWWNDTINKEIRSMFSSCGRINVRPPTFDSYASTVGKTTLLHTPKKVRGVAMNNGLLRASTAEDGQSTHSQL
uniref:G_PROTEIN_RECEP_F1_2 domain-containing protein n=1 Tax=Steinernema glaseri TaxID=37863 RepID=A0A1I7Z375_9BILA